MNESAYPHLEALNAAVQYVQEMGETIQTLTEQLAAAHERISFLENNPPQPSEEVIQQLVNDRTSSITEAYQTVTAERDALQEKLNFIRDLL